MEATFANIAILVSIGDNSFEGGCAGGGDEGDCGCWSGGYYESWYGGG